MNTNVVEKLREHLQEERERASLQYEAAVLAAFTRPQQSDVREIAAIASAASKTIDDFEKDVARYATRVECQAAAENLPTLRSERETIETEQAARVAAFEEATELYESQRAALDKLLSRGQSRVQHLLDSAPKFLREAKRGVERERAALERKLKSRVVATDDECEFIGSCGPNEWKPRQFVDGEQARAALDAVRRRRDDLAEQKEPMRDRMMTLEARLTELDRLSLRAIVERADVDRVLADVHDDDVFDDEDGRDE